MTHYRIYFFFLLTLFSSGFAVSQELEQELKEKEEFKHHVFSITLGHTHIPKGFNGNSKAGSLIVPSWGLNYTYRFNEKWAIGSHNDMEISTYVIENGEGTELERERPIIISLVGLYSPFRYTSFIMGFGREFETNESFWVFRAGVEFEFELNDKWAFSPSLILDLKEDVYDSWTIGIGILRMR